MSATYNVSTKHPSSVDRKLTAMLQNSMILDQAQNEKFQNLKDGPKNDKSKQS